MTDLSDVSPAPGRAAGREQGDDPMGPPQALARTLAILCARGRAAHPDLPLDDAAFVAHLARCEAPVAGGPDAAHAEDLFVACAGLAGSAAAVERLHRAHRGSITAYLRVIDSSAATLDDVEQRLWDGLLVSAHGQPGKLATYSGRGPLGAFLGVAAQRIALDGCRHESAELRALATMAAEVNAVAADAEIALLKGRYTETFEQAVRDALDLLDARERMLLRMHIVDGLTLERIGK